MRKKVKSVAGIEVSGMDLKLRIKKRSDKFKIGKSLVKVECDLIIQ